MENLGRTSIPIKNINLPTVDGIFLPNIGASCMGALPPPYSVPPAPGGGTPTNFLPNRGTSSAGVTGGGMLGDSSLKRFPKTGVSYS